MRFHHALAAVGLAAATCAAHADVYTIQHVLIDDYYRPYAVDDFGNYELKTFGHQGCGSMTQDCYMAVFTDGQTSYSFSPIPLLQDPSPIAGAGCPPPGKALELVSCANGHPIYYSPYVFDDPWKRGLYDGNKPWDHLPYVTTYDGLGVESASGNFIYDDGLADDLDLAIDHSTLAIAPTPEPSSFALLGTGLLGVAGMMRRRFAR